MKCIVENVDKSKRMCYTSYETCIGVDEMTTVEILKDLIDRSTKQQKDVADALGWTQQNLSNRFRRNSISSDEFIKIIEFLGYSFKIVEVETSEEIKTRQKGVGERLKMMVNGVVYDTFKSDAICHSDETEDMFHELYKDSEGRYFVAQYVKWEGGVNSITPIGELDAMKMIGKLK